MMIETTPFDPAKYITERSDIVELLDDAFGTGEAGYIRRSLGLAAKKHGMTRLARETGINRQTLYTALGPDGNPTLDTLMKVAKAMSLRLRCEEMR